MEEARRLLTSRKDRLFTGCGPKTCCEQRIVEVTTADVERIATALQIPETSVCSHDPDTPGRRVLARSPDGCSFLLALVDGSRRCGLGDLRPMACRTFPCSLEQGLVQVRDDARHCECRAWSLADVDLAEERAVLEAAVAETHAQLAR